ncbi:glycoside hydrolase family 3 N-terminal domain-containing protein [Cohnella sp. 56]|uniref:glycoside hydrolase family 3 N-terminal domain-containing protein n=1 Tax=Cohnella sp. 56 TaxID=3113722 RepID=UPI0030E9AA2A
MIRKRARSLASSLMLSSLLTGLLPGLAQAEQAAPPQIDLQGESVQPAASSMPLYLDKDRELEERVADLLGRMTLDEKVGQMVQAERANVTPADVKQYYLGSVLSGGGSFPNGKQSDSTVDKWAELVNSYQDAALSTRLGIPILYGVDAVHGHNNVLGATIFPHNIGIGASRDTALAEQIGAATAEEMRASGTNWAFAPTIADPQDIRWGRTYEGFGDDAGLVGDMGAAYVKGLQGETADRNDDPDKVVSTVKHYLGEGYTDNGTNQGNVTQFTEQQIVDKDLGVYKKAIDAGAMTVMASYSSIGGIKMHANQRLLTDALKGTGEGQLGFKGFVISDYNAAQQIKTDWNGNAVSGLKDQIRVSVNAGVDMFMMTSDWKATVANLKALAGDDIASPGSGIPMTRLDDAVSRILRVKLQAGVFENSRASVDLTSAVGSAEHRAIARKAVAESLVLLKNDVVGGAPILSRLGGMQHILVAGKSADDIGIQSGGWTISWQGAAGSITTGTTILQGIKNVAGSDRVTYNKHGLGSAGKDAAIVVVGEAPYAEGTGDITSQTGLNLNAEDLATLRNVRAGNPGIPIVVVLVSGRPMMISEQMQDWAGLVEAWLPGTEGQGVADVLFGSQDFTGKLPMRWPFYLSAYPMYERQSPKLLFDYGYGLTKHEATPTLAANPARTAVGASDAAKIEAENYSVKSSALKVETTAAASEGEGAKDVTGAAANEYLEFPLRVEQAGYYDIDIRYSSTISGTSTGLQVLDANGTQLGMLTVLSTGGEWQTGTVRNVALKQGDQTIRLKLVGNLLNLNWLSIKRTGDAPVVPVVAVPESGAVKFETESYSAKSDKVAMQTADGVTNAGFAASGEWLEYTLDVAKAGTYTLNVHYATGATSAVGFNIVNSRGELAGKFANSASTGGYATYADKQVTGIVLPDAGKQKLRFEYTSGSLNLDWFQLTRTGDAPVRTVVKAQAVESWISRERDPVNREWYYASRYQPGDQKLEQQPKLDIVAKDAAFNATTINVDPTKQYQSIMGIGTSVDESSVHNLWKMSGPARASLIDKMFNPDTGAGISMMRLTIGTADFTAQPFYSYDDMPKGQTDVNLEHFSIQKDKDYHIIDTIKQIQAANPNMQFFASAWSPPGWMKTTDSMIKGTVKDEYLPVLAKYYVKYLQAYKSEGINISALTMINEPLLEIEYPSTNMPWQQQARLAKLLRAELDASGFKDVKIWIFDHNPSSTSSYPTPILSDESARNAVDGTAFHDYGGELSNMTTLHNAFPTKNVYLTERAVWGTSGADRMAQYFRNWAKSYNSWVFMLDSDIATHQWTGTPDPTPIVQDSGNPDNYWLLPEFYLLAQYSKFVKPGYIRIDSDYGSSSTVTNVSFMSPDAKKLVTVAINQTSKPQNIRIVSEGSQFSAVIPAQSVATYQWDRLGTGSIVNQAKLTAEQSSLPYNVAGRTVSLKLEGGTFVADKANAIVLSGTGATEGGVSIQSATVVGEHQVDVKLAWNNTVYYKDLKLTFSVPPAAYADSSAGAVLTTDVTLRGTDRATAPALVTDPLDLSNYAQKSGMTGVTASQLSGIATGDWIDYKLTVPDQGGAYIATLQEVPPAGSSFLLNDQNGNTLASFIVPNQYNSTSPIQARLPVTLAGGEQKLRLYAAASDANVKVQGLRFEPVAAQTVDGTLEVKADSYTNATPMPVVQLGTTFNNLGYTTAGMKFEYLLNVAAEGYYNVSYNYATNQNGVTVTFNQDGAALATTSLPFTGGWGNYQSAVATVHLNAGIHTIQLVDNVDGFNLASFTLSKTDTPPVVQSGKLSRVTAAIAPGERLGTKTVTLSTMSVGAAVYYTLDGSLPTAAAGMKYAEPLVLERSAYIRAVAVRDGWQDSDVSAYAVAVAPLTAAGVADTIRSLAPPERDAAALKLPAVPEGYTVTIKSSDREDVIDAHGVIAPPEADTAVTLVLTVTRIADGTTADTASLTVVVPARTPASATAADVAQRIVSIPAPERDATALTLPVVPAGFAVAIKSSDREDVIDEHGVIAPQDADTTVTLVLTVTKTEDGTTADTASLTVVVPARTPAEAGMTALSVASGIYGLAAPAKDATRLTLPAVPADFEIKIKSTDRPDVVSDTGTIAPPAVETIVHLVLVVTRISDGMTADTRPLAVIVPARTPYVPETPPPVYTPPVVTAPVSPGTQVVKSEELARAVDGKVTVAIGSDTKRIELPADAFRLIGANKLILSAGELSLTIPSAILKQLAGGIADDQLADSRIAIKLGQIGDADKSALLAAGDDAGNTLYRAAGHVYDLELALVAKDGKETKPAAFDAPILLRLKVDPSMNARLSGIYYIADDGKLEYIGGKYESGAFAAEIRHFSKYAVLEMTKSFDDVPAGYWAADAIAEMAAKHIVNGVSATSFAPGGSITRAEFAAFLVRSLGLTATDAAAFDDVSPTAWYADAVAAAVQSGIARGKSDRVFDPNGRITRQEMVVMLMRAYSVRHSGASDVAQAAVFKDEAKVAPWAVEAVRASAALGLVNGRQAGLFEPAGLTSRAEAVVVLQRLLQQ